MDIEKLRKSLRDYESTPPGSAERWDELEWMKDRGPSYPDLARSVIALTEECREAEVQRAALEIRAIALTEENERLKARINELSARSAPYDL
jgi:hypothetical protein